MSDLPALIAARYGETSAAGKSVASNSAGAADLGALPATAPALATLLAHKSVRHFAADQPLPPGTLDVLVAAAQSAASSCNLQTYSIVVVQDPARKDRLAALSGDQDFVRQAPLFLLFVADLNRLGQLQLDHQTTTPGICLGYLEMFVMASVDAALAAQNAVVAAEALGLGTCYVGSARNHPREVAALLGLPDRCVALLGLSVGVADRAHAHPETAAGAPVKPRLPAAAVVHHEQWQPGDGTAQRAHVATYNRVMSVFNANQERDEQAPWAARSAQRVAALDEMEGRHQLREALHSRGFELK